MPQSLRTRELTPIRVAVTGLPQMVNDLISSILEREADVEIVGRGAAEELSHYVVLTKAQVVVTASSPAFAKTAQSLLLKHPTLVLMTISSDGRTARRYRLVGECQNVREVSPDELLETIRAAAGSHCFFNP